MGPRGFDLMSEPHEEQKADQSVPWLSGFEALDSYLGATTNAPAQLWT